MSPSAFFVQNCPVCGRPLEIRAVYLGRQVSCQHCGGRFVASDPACRHDRVGENGIELLERAERLLQQSTLRLAHLRGAA